MEVWRVGFFFLGGIVCTWAMIRNRNAKAQNDHLKRVADLDRISAKQGRLRNQDGPALIMTRPNPRVQRTRPCASLRARR